jgi:hypothetical protein
MKNDATNLALLALHLAVFLAYYVLLLLLTFIHEMGHLVAGSLCHLRLCSLRVGPVHI